MLGLGFGAHERGHFVIRFAERFGDCAADVAGGSGEEDSASNARSSMQRKKEPHR